MLVWSEAWSAEGEKGKTSCFLKHTLTRACVPTASAVAMAFGTQAALAH
jgi:hypothetical protein